MSEAKSCTERKANVVTDRETGRGPSRGERTPLLVAAWPAEAGPARRETTDPSIAPHARFSPQGERSDEAAQARSKAKSAGTGLRKIEWLAEVGRTHLDTRVRARVPSSREVVVAWTRTTVRTRANGCAGSPRDLSTDTEEKSVSHVKAYEGRSRRKAFWIVRMCAPHRAFARRF